MSNNWRIRLYNSWNDFRVQSLQGGGFKLTLNNQATQIPRDSSVQQCIEHMKNLYLLDIYDGIKYAEVFAENLKTCYDWYTAFEADTGARSEPPVITEPPLKNGCAEVILQATQDHNNSSAQIQTLCALREKVEAQGIDAFPSTMLQATFEGEVLHRWINGLQANPKIFNENYGMSKVMDILHLAVFLPTVDVITVDKATFNRCQQPEIKTIISKYPCSLLRANENQFELENWLDELLNQPESDEFKATRRLFCGMNHEEETRWWNELFAEVIDKISKERPQQKIPTVG